jgi:hypothetical protein
MIIGVIISIVGLYILSGVLFAIPFLIKGVTTIDEGAHGTKLGFRIMILPGTIIFWPVLLRKWINAKKRND